MNIACKSEVATPDVVGAVGSLMEGLYGLEISVELLLLRALCLAIPAMLLELGCGRQAGCQQRDI